MEAGRGAYCNPIHVHARGVRACAPGQGTE